MQEGIAYVKTQSCEVWVIVGKVAGVNPEYNGSRKVGLVLTKCECDLFARRRSLILFYSKQEINTVHDQQIFVVDADNIEKNPDNGESMAYICSTQNSSQVIVMTSWDMVHNINRGCRKELGF